MNKADFVGTSNERKTQIPLGIYPFFLSQSGIGLTVFIFQFRHRRLKKTVTALHSRFFFKMIMSQIILSQAVALRNSIVFTGLHSKIYDIYYEIWDYQNQLVWVKRPGNHRSNDF